MNIQLFVGSFSTFVFFLILILMYYSFRFKKGFLEKSIEVTYLSIGFVYWMFYLNTTGKLIFPPYFYGVGEGVWILAVVLLYYCARLVFHKPISWKELLLLIPVFLYFVNLAPLIFQNSEYKVDVVNEVLSNKIIYTLDKGWLFSGNFILILIVLHRYLCAALIGYLLWNNRQQKNPNYANEIIVKFYFWFVLLSILPELLSFFDINLNLFSKYLYLTMAITFSLLYFLNPRLFEKYDLNRKSLNINSEQEHLNELEISPESVLSESDYVNVRERAVIMRIENCIDNERPYLDLNFSLRKLEKKLGIPSKKISLCLKDKYNLNFNQFINKNRIDFLLKMLEEDKKWRNFSVEALAINSGFNSTNSLYNYFKMFTGKTPRVYIDYLELKNVIERDKSSITSELKSAS
jgi:AraC-like DNA-binding protein